MKHRKRFSDLGGQVEPFARLAIVTPLSEDGESHTYERKLGALVRAANRPGGLSETELMLVRGRLGAHKRRFWSHPLLTPRWAIVAALLLASGGVVVAESSVGGWPRATLEKIARYAQARSGSGFLDRHGKSKRRELIVPLQEAPPAARPPEIAAGIPPAPLAIVEIPAARRVRAAPRPPHITAEISPMPDPPPDIQPVSPLADESDLISRALMRLRQAHDPEGALAELDRYAAKFPLGVLAPEAAAARVDALLSSGRTKEVSLMLAHWNWGRTPRDRELRLIRGELAAESSCREALVDFRDVLALGRTDHFAERALWGEAACLERKGNEDAIRSVLSEYLLRFPNGEHRAAAERRLAR